jgi:hypothetical protein
VQTLSGKELCILWHNTYLTDEKGNVTGVVSSGEEVTDKKRPNAVCDS